MSAINFPPSKIIRVRQGSKLVPPLGDLDPETRHLNIDWTAGRCGWNHRSLAASPAHTSARGGPDSAEDANPRSDPRSSINSISSPGHEGNREAAGAAVAGVGNSERGRS